MRLLVNTLLQFSGLGPPYLSLSVNSFRRLMPTRLEHSQHVIGVDRRDAYFAEDWPRDVLEGLAPLPTVLIIFPACLMRVHIAATSFSEGGDIHLRANSGDAVPASFHRINPAL